MFKLAIVVFSALVVGLCAHDLGFGSIQRFQKARHPKILPFPSPKIVGGEDAQVGEFPYQVSLQIRGWLPIGHFCGGSILSESIILTAGHCVTEVNPPFGDHIEAVAGIVNLKNEGSNMQKSKVIDKIVHPDYDGGVNPNDIAILFLETPLKFNEFVAPISLPDAGVEPTGETTLSGWGSISHTETPTYPSELQKASLPIISYEECEAAFGLSSPLSEESNVCTGDVGQTLSACSGDSGGPLVIADGNKTTIVGVVSWGNIPCGYAPSVYTKVSSFIDFIKKYL